MLNLPEKQSAELFLQKYWQRRSLFMPGALPHIRPKVTRNELAWLATLDDVESQLVFVDRSDDQVRYRVETGPFDDNYLQGLPRRDWTLLVHDVEKHLPAMRTLFRQVPFIPDWRIDDLMVSFAAPGGGVGPHRDNYDVFLCQGIGVREWRTTSEALAADPGASDELALLQAFAGDEIHDAVEGDILYVPPGVAHWGTAKRACMTYSIGMRAPQAADIAFALNRNSPDGDAFYQDRDLSADEATPGYISNQAAARAADLLQIENLRLEDVADALGQIATRPKDWLRPDAASLQDAHATLDYLRDGGRLSVHGMALIAFDDHRLYVNGSSRNSQPGDSALIKDLCANRALKSASPIASSSTEMLLWMLQHGAFELPEHS